MSDVVSDAPASIERLLRIATAAFVVVLALLVASAVTAPIADLAVRAGLVDEGTNRWRLLRTVVQFAGFLAAVLGYLAVTDGWDLLRVSRPTPWEAGLVVGGGVGLLGFQYAALFVLREVGLTTAQNQAVVPAGDPAAYYLAMIAVSILVVGPVEEVLFRGVVQGGLRRAFDAAPAVLIASLLFGLVHLSALEGTAGQRWAYVAVVVALGCVLGVLYERTNNVLVPGLAHGVYNAGIYAVLLASTV
jgi:membrane protease YdiL (CAAX protease family)